MERINVGGQAVIEGVMMRSPNSFTVAVRKPDGSIVVKEDIWHSIWKRFKFLKFPFFRGGVVLFEAMHNGIKALTFSANQAVPEAEKSKATDSKKTEELSSLTMTFTIILSIVVGFLLFGGLPHLLTQVMGSLFGQDFSGKSVLFHLIDGVFKILIFLGYVWLISLFSDFKRVFMYHGAEHKAIYAYENGEELTVANAKKYTTKHPRCGTSFILIVLIVSIFIFSFVFPFMPTFSEVKLINQSIYVLIKLPLMFPIAGIAYELTKLSGKYRNHPLVRIAVAPGLFLQRFTTIEPTDEQLEIAIVSLEMALWREKVGIEAFHSKTKEFEVYQSFSEFETFLLKLDEART